MKRLLLLNIFIFLFLGKDIQAQRDKIINLPNKDKSTWNFAYYLGIMKTDYFIAYKNSAYPEAKVDVEAGYGFKIGIIGEYRFNKNLSIRLEPGMASSVKNLYFNNDVLVTKTDSLREVPSTYLHVPLLLKFNANRLDNIRPFVIGGVSYDYNFSSNQDNPDDNRAGEFRLKKHNFMYELGIGIDFYLSYFKFSPSIVGVFAMNNELVPDNNDTTSPYTGPIENLSTRGIFLKLVFD